MRILLVHNYYQQRGGEDESFDAETQMLSSFGHEVKTYTRHNDDIQALAKSKVAFETIWNRKSYDELKQMLHEFQPDVMHCTNLFPLISPSVYNAANECGVPVVQSLRNYRAMCVNSNFYRNNGICENCLTKRFAWPGVAHGCYKGSRLASAIVASHNAYHRIFRTSHKRVDRFFAPTEFARQKYIEAGFPGDRIDVKPNFLSPDPGVANGPREFALFVGRLSVDKGLKTLVNAWTSLNPNLTLRIVGSGFLEKYAAQAAQEFGNISYEGQLPLDQVKDLVGRAKFLVMPSEWYETFGRTIMEAYSRGTPVIASRLGAMAELVSDGNTGISFTPGNAPELSEAISKMMSDDELRIAMGINARRAFEEKYTAEVNHERILQIYQNAQTVRRRFAQGGGS